MITSADTLNLDSLDKAKYLALAKSQGIDHALTELHKEIWELENQCFEGKLGFDSNLWKLLKEFRQFSIELWNLKLIPGFENRTNQSTS